MADLPEASRRLLESAPGLDTEIHFFPEGTKTAEDAATAVGCPVSAIIKSLVFILVTQWEQEPVVALIPGDRRLDTDKLADFSGADICKRATLDEVKAATGYAAGGTPAFGHVRDLRVFADHSLRRNDPVWTAAGTPNTVLPISLADLDELARPVWADIS